MNVKKIFFKAPAECFIKLLDDKERDVGFSDIVNYSLAHQHLTTGHGLEECKSELGIYFSVPDNAIDLGMEIISKHSESVKFDIERKVFLDFFISHKDEIDYVLQIAFMALNTMIGQNRTYCRIYNDLWLLRMSGKTEYKGNLHPVIKRYADPRKLRKVKESLSLRFGMNFSTKKTRGFLASRIHSSEELDAILEKSKPAIGETSSKEKARQKSKAVTNQNEENAAKQKEQPLWRTDFNEYKRLFEEARKTVLADVDFKKKMEGYYHNIDYEKSIDCSCDYWISEDGWKKCKSYRCTNIYPVRRLKNNFSKNKIYKYRYSGNNKPQDYRHRSGQYNSTDMDDWNKGKI